jgi:hypothetical protein
MPAGKYDRERKLSGVHFVSMTVSRQNKKLPCAIFHSAVDRGLSSSRRMHGRVTEHFPFRDGAPPREKFCGVERRSPTKKLFEIKRTTRPDATAVIHDACASSN